MDLNNYRIRRVGPKNIAIQEKKKGKGWRSISWHGNSLNSLISGLFELIMYQHTPEQEKLSEALLDVKLELVSGIEEVEKMIRRWSNDSLIK